MTKPKLTEDNVVGGRAMFSGSYMSRRGAVLNDPAASAWLKGAVCALEARDPVDAFSDAEALAAIAKERMEAAFRNPEYGGMSAKENA